MGLGLSLAEEGSRCVVKGFRPMPDGQPNPGQASLDIFFLRKESLLFCAATVFVPLFSCGCVQYPPPVPFLFGEWGIPASAIAFVLHCC